MITLNELKQAEAEYDRTRAALSKVGRDIYNIRNPEHKLDSGYGLSRWYDITPKADQYRLDDSDLIPGYLAGEALIVISYYHSRWEDSQQVTFPASYLDGTDAYLEDERLAHEERLAKIAAKKESDRLARQEQAAIERRNQYERLKAEFEGQSNA